MMKKTRSEQFFTIAIIAIATELLLACWIVTATAAGGSRAAATNSQQAAAGVKTVEQVQKNIQVLKGLPEAQLIPVMNFMSASLGVRCDFCHVNKDGNWDFASDEKGEKKAARGMITMVLGINKNNFRGNTEVSCYTCHRGHTAPQGVPQFPLPEPTLRATPAEQSSAKENVPTADQVLEKYLEAVGGGAALEKLKTRTLKGTWISSNGTASNYEMFQTAPNKVLTVMTTPEGVLERAFNGTVGWERSAKGVRDMTDEEMVYLKRYPDFFFKDIKLKDQFSRIAMAVKDKIDGREVYVLRGTTTDNRRERLYFEVQSGLLVRRVSIMPTSIGNIPEQVDFEDYRDVDGMKIPFTIRVQSIDPFNSSTRKFTEIKLNVPIDDSRFNKPGSAK